MIRVILIIYKYYKNFSKFLNQTYFEYIYLMSTLYSYSLQPILINQCCIEYEWISTLLYSLILKISWVAKKRFIGEEPWPKKHVKFVRMWRFCLMFSTISMAWCIMNSCHKVIRSIGNTILKLCAYCAKQFVRNA